MAKSIPVFLEPAELLDIYDYYADDFRNDKAYEVLKRAVSLYPDDMDVIIAHAYYHKNTGDWKKATQIINKLPSDSIFRKMFYAEKALLTLDLKGCRRLVDEIANSGQELNQDNMLDIAEMYYEAGYYHLAEPWLRKCNDPHYDEYVRAASELADCVFRRGDYDATISLLNHCLDENPYDAATWVQLAKVQYTDEKFEDALESCEYAIAANKDCADAYSVRLDTLLRLKRYDDMWNDLHNINYQIAFSVENYANLAQAYQMQNEYEKASFILHLGVQQFSDNREELDRMHRYLAQEALREGRDDDAYDLVYRHMDRENYNSRHIMWATLLFIVNRVEEGLDALRLVFKSQPVKDDDLSNLVYILQTGNCYEAAQDIWSNIIVYSKGHEHMYSAPLAYAAFRIHHPEFVELLEQGVENDFISTVSLLEEDFDFKDPKKTMAKARSLVNQWKKESEQE